MFQKTDSKLIYSGKIFDLREDTYTMPDGRVGKFDTIAHNGAAAVIPVLEDGRIVLVRQFRHALEQETLEIPAGRLDAGEDALVCAKRELTEETGYHSDNVRFLMKIYPAIGYSNEFIDLFVADRLSLGATDFDDDEFLTNELYTLDEIHALIQDGSMVDAKTIAAVLSYEAFAAKK